MAEYTQNLFGEDETLGTAEEVMLGLQRRARWLKPVTIPAWELLKDWKLRQPVEMRNPVSPELLRAVISLSFSWEWYALGICSWLGWHCYCGRGRSAI